MGKDDKLKNTAQGAKGGAKRKAGKATGNRNKEAEGRADQAKANLKQAGEKTKDAFK